MPTSKQWETPLPIGTPVMADVEGGWKARSIVSVRKGDRTPWTYMVEGTTPDADGFAPADWVGMGSVRPVDKDDPDQLMEWLDG